MFLCLDRTKITNGNEIWYFVSIAGVRFPGKAGSTGVEERISGPVAVPYPQRGNLEYTQIAYQMVPISWPSRKSEKCLVLNFRQVVTYCM